MIIKKPKENEPGNKDAYLYEKLARQLAQLIQQGTYRAGERIPSVRQMSRQQNASISSVLQAYRVLESQG